MLGTRHGGHPNGLGASYTQKQSDQRNARYHHHVAIAQREVDAALTNCDLQETIGGNTRKAGRRLRKAYAALNNATSHWHSY